MASLLHDRCIAGHMMGTSVQLLGHRMKRALLTCKMHELLLSGPEKDLDQLSARGVKSRIMS